MPDVACAQENSAALAPEKDLARSGRHQRAWWCDSDPPFWPNVALAFARETCVKTLARCNRKFCPVSTMPENQTEQPLTTGEWVVTHLVLLIPLVNIVMHFVWAFGDGNISRRNFCRARLLLFAIFFGIAMIVAAGLLIFTGVFAGLMSHGLR